MMANDLLQQAITAYKKGQREIARDLLLKFVENDTTSEMSWLLLGDLVEDPADQIVALENALVINPINNPVRAYLEKLKAQHQSRQEKREQSISDALAAKKNGQYREALNILRQLIEDGYEDEEIWMLISEVAPSRKNQIIALKKVLSLNPNHSDAKIRLEAIQSADDDPFELGQRYEEYGELQAAIDLYQRISIQSQSSDVRQEAKRRLNNAKIRLTAPEFKQVKPQFTLARMTFGPILFFSILIFLHGGLNLLKIPLMLWIGWPIVILGSFLVVITDDQSTAYFLYTLWKRVGGKRAVPSLGIKRLGILLILMPFIALIIDSFIRFQTFWPLLWD